MKEIITCIINRWDPIDLLSFAPQDEYENEINDILELVNKSVNGIELANGIYEIFIKSFGKDTFNKNLNDCIIIAKLIIGDVK